MIRNYVSKKNKHLQKLVIYEKNSIVQFGKNLKHTDVINMQNDLQRTQRKEGLRTERSKR